MVAEGNSERGTIGVLLMWNDVPALGAPTAGRLVPAAADSTPGSSRISRSAFRKNSLDRSSEYRVWDSASLIVTSPRGSNPWFTLLSATTVRTIRPAPHNRMTVIATCATTSVWRMRGEWVTRELLALSELAVERRATMNEGTRPAVMPVSRDNP